jgi:hypothetical protein
VPISSGCATRTLAGGRYGENIFSPLMPFAISFCSRLLWDGGLEGCIVWRYINGHSPGLPSHGGLLQEIRRLQSGRLCGHLPNIISLSANSVDTRRLGFVGL